MDAIQKPEPQLSPVLRPPQQVMKLARLGSFHQTRLSFMRALLRSLKQEQWQFSRGSWEMDANGVGHALYHARTSQRHYTLVCFTNDLPADKRSDRVIAQEWDATFALFDGDPDEKEIARLAQNVPKQEVGQYQKSELVLARANRSVRLFDHVVTRLADGMQPDPELLLQSGYLMRTTAVYANGKFGLSDRERIADRAEFNAPFRAELLTVWLIRWFTIDLAEHIAQHLHASQANRSNKTKAKAVKMHRDVARQLGVGNATGLGMAPFLLLHPSLLHRWIHARETALARVCALDTSCQATQLQFSQLLERMKLGLERWHTEDPRQSQRITKLKTDLAEIQRHHEKNQQSQQTMPWANLLEWSQTALSMEGQELLVTLMIEPHGELVDDLSEHMAIDETHYWRICGDKSIAELIRIIDTDYSWALATDYTETSQCARFWYVSEEKLEPRLGERFTEPGAEKELPLAFARDIKALRADLSKTDANQRVAEFLLAYPQHRHAVRRLQIVTQLPYSEIHDNLISAELMPIDLLRCKLSFFGATQFDPKSDRWVRITMYQHAPFPDEIKNMDADDWSYPPIPNNNA